jgi:hypothetical protein
MKSRFLTGLFLLLTFGCSPLFEGTFNSREIVSSQGEKIYINSLNWGMTDDNQISVVTSNPNKLKERCDGVSAVKGLEPFIYTFKNDTLELFFKNKITYRVEEKFNSVFVKYTLLKSRVYAKIRIRSNDNDDYYSVPMKKEVHYPSDMPKPLKQ